METSDLAVEVYNLIDQIHVCCGADAGLISREVFRRFAVEISTRTIHSYIDRTHHGQAMKIGPQPSVVPRTVITRQELALRASKLGIKPAPLGIEADKFGRWKLSKPA